MAGFSAVIHLVDGLELLDLLEGRVLVPTCRKWELYVMTHNTDIADGWEREAEDDQFFFLFSPQSYALGINIVLYALTH